MNRDSSCFSVYQFFHFQRPERRHSNVKSKDKSYFKYSNQKFAIITALYSIIKSILQKVLNFKNMIFSVSLVYKITSSKLLYSVGTMNTICEALVFPTFVIFSLVIRWLALAYVSSSWRLLDACLECRLMTFFCVNDTQMDGWTDGWMVRSGRLDRCWSECLSINQLDGQIFGFLKTPEQEEEEDESPWKVNMKNKDRELAMLVSFAKCFSKEVSTQKKL